jgi:phosphatidylethanolamine/phosphatidyl-N-methylethanolamine N-methyltransferase
MTVSKLIYGPLSPLYDFVCGAMLQPGRRRALSLLNAQPGERILEVGAGSGYNINGYPSSCRVCRVVAIDLSAPMLDRAKQRVDDAHRDVVRFAQMDATRLAFPDEAFDAVFVPHTINVLPDPFAAGHEIVRVCRPHGRIVFLNHFADLRDTSEVVDKIAGRLASAADVNWNLPLQKLVSALHLRVIQVEPVNVPKLSSAVLCEPL